MLGKWIWAVHMHIHEYEFNYENWVKFVKTQSRHVTKKASVELNEVDATVKYEREWSRASAAHPFPSGFRVLLKINGCNH